MSTAETKPVVTADATPASKPAPAPQPKATKVAKKGPKNGPVKAPVKAPAKSPAKATKSVPPKAAAKDQKTQKSAKAAKEKKVKMVRDSFAIPKPEFEVLAALKLRAAKLALPVKKTELIRAGIKALAALSDAAFIAGVRSVPNLKTGRPAKTA